MEVHADAQLVARFRDGAAAALDALFERYERPVFQFLLGLLRDHHRAEDALQETFVKALEQIDRVDPAKLRGWLYTVAYRQAMLVRDRKSTRLNSSHLGISYAVFCLKKKKKKEE